MLIDVEGVLISRGYKVLYSDHLIVLAGKDGLRVTVMTNNKNPAQAIQVTTSGDHFSFKSSKVYTCSSGLSAKTVAEALDDMCVIPLERTPVSDDWFELAKSKLQQYIKYAEVGLPVSTEDISGIRKLKLIVNGDPMTFFMSRFDSAEAITELLNVMRPDNLTINPVDLKTWELGVIGYTFKNKPFIRRKTRRY